MSLRVLVANGWARYTSLSLPADSGTVTMTGLIYRPSTATWSFFSPTLILGVASGSRAVPYEYLGMYGGTWQVEMDGSGGYDSGLSTALPSNTWCPFVYHHAGPHTGSYADITIKINGLSYTRNSVGSALGTTFDRLMILNETDGSRGYDGARLLNFGITSGLTWAQAQQQYIDCQTLTVDGWANLPNAGWKWSTDNARTVGTGGTYNALNMTFDATGDPALTGGGPPPILFLDFPSSPTDGQLYANPATGAVYQWSAAGGRWITKTGPTTIYYLPLSGGTMTGDIVLKGNADQPLEPATKQQLDAVSTAAATGAQAAMSAAGNLIINGSMEVWQRGTSFSLSSNAYANVVDRWHVVAGAGAALTVQQVIHDPGDPQPVSVLINRTTAGSTSSWLGQKIDDVRTANGQTVVISFSVFSTVAGNLVVALNQNFGTGGSPSANVPGTYQNVAVAASGNWERKTLTYALPNIFGKTLGTDNNHSLDFYIGISDTLGTGAWYFTNVDVRLGTVAPAQFLRRSYAEELVLCQWYFQVRYSAQIDLPYAPAVGTYFWGLFTIQQMRRNPTTTYSNVTYNQAQAGSLATDYTSANSVGVHAQAGIAGAAAIVTFDLALDAEL